MNRRLLLKLLVTIAVGTVLLFWAIDWLTRQTEAQMSFLAEPHQQQLLAYGREAERLYLAGDEAELERWINEIQQKEQTWAAVVRWQLNPQANSTLMKLFVDEFTLGRGVSWKIHLDFDYNPVMDVGFSDPQVRFLIKLPQRMRPGVYLPFANLLLQVALPFVLLCLLTLLLYHHVMKPLRKLESATHQFSQGRLDVRIRPDFGSREDELTALAGTFDQMAERTSRLIHKQRQMLSDLSHELRTPLARIDTALDCLEQGIDPEQAKLRLRNDSANMRKLVEDALTLAWLKNENPRLTNEDFDLAELLEVICEDARFEYPQHQLLTEMPRQAPITASSQQALGQALENVIRNALSHTPADGQVRVSLTQARQRYQILIEDQGPGVPEQMLKTIFKPFFRVDKARSEQRVSATNTLERGGFGLGLALARRQVDAVGGSIWAENLGSSPEQPKGLRICLELPC